MLIVNAYSVALLYHQVRIISRAYRKKFEHFSLHHMEPVVVLVHPDLGEHLIDEVLICPAVAFALNERSNMSHRNNKRINEHIYSSSTPQHTSSYRIRL